MIDRETIRANACQLSDDDWQAFTTRETAMAIGRWFEAGGKLERPIRTLTLRELEAIADRVISRWVVMSSIRLKERPAASEKLGWLLMD